MSVLLLLHCLVLAAVLHCPGDVAGQFTAIPPTCPGDTFTFRCTVTGNMSGLTIWRVTSSTEGESSRCNLIHRTLSSPICGPGNVFTARSESGFGTNGTSFTSTLSGTATPELDGTLVECLGTPKPVDPWNRISDSTLQIRGLPSVPTLSCVDLTGDVSGAVNVTVSWTLNGRDSADFYLINITTNASHTPYGGLLNITTASVTQYELTGFMADYEYNITVRGVNCGMQEGNESEPLTITPQLPGVLRSCNITLTYNQSTDRLQFISSTWDTTQDPPDFVEACQGPRGVITQYQTRFLSGSYVDVVNVNSTRCTAGRCSHTFQPPSNLSSNYGRVLVAAKNVVGMGIEKTCTTHTINATNNLLTGEMVNVSSPTNATVTCTFLSGFTGSAHCQVQYGTDPTYTNLPYSAESTESGRAGDTVIVVLRQRLSSPSLYYYTVSAVSGDVTVTVQGTFTAPQYSCSLMELWDLSTTNAIFLDDVSLLDDAAQYRSCVTDNFRSAVLKHTTLNIATVAYYNGTTPGSRVCFVCDGYELNVTINERVCQSNATWSGGPITCVPKTCTQQHSLMEWHITLIVISVLALVVSIVIIITMIVVSCHRMDVVKWWLIIVIVIVAILCVIGVVLWITVGAVVTNPPDDNTCDPGWHHSRDVLIISGLVFSIFPIILVPTLLLIYTPIRIQVLVCCKKCEKVFRLEVLITNIAAMIMTVLLMVLPL